MDDERDDGLFELADVLARLGREMQRAAEVETPTIQWYGADVELESVVERSADGNLRFWVVGAGGKVTDRTTVKVTVHISPYGGEPLAAGK